MTPPLSSRQAPFEDVNKNCIHTLTTKESIGLLVNVEVACASIIAVLIAFVLIMLGVIRSRRTDPLQPWSELIQSPLQIYMLSLFFADLIQGIGQALSIRWIVKGTVECGTFCTAQGATQQIGETAVALSTLAIALHTFIIIFFRLGFRAKKTASLFLIPIWLFVILFTSIEVGLHGEGSNPYITPTPYWCWIGRNYDPIRLAGEYVWFFITVVVSVILYVLLYLRLRRILIVERHRWWRIHFCRPPSFRARPQAAAGQPNGGALPAPQPNIDDPRPFQASAVEAFKMLLYPLAYIFVVLGISIARFSKNGIDHNGSPAATFAVNSLFSSSGLVNVVLWLSTRRRFVLNVVPEVEADRVPMAPRGPIDNFLHQ